ncbi:unnamed protein product [Closterium sp. NIES-64]|nr:unnamed protein product [Closterium sp. NIES-64]CAI5952930.1 unnamed protein product [Closterium sp. NIES-65]
MSTGDGTNSLVHVSSSRPDVWWSFPDNIAKRLPLPPGRWQRIEVSDSSLAGIGGAAVGLPDTILSFSDVLLLKLAMGGDQMEVGMFGGGGGGGTGIGRKGGSEFEAAMLSFSDMLLMQGKRAVPVGGGQVEGLEAAAAFVTRLLPSLVDSRTVAPHTQNLEFGQQYEQEPGHEHRQRLQHFQQDCGSDVRVVGDERMVDLHRDRQHTLTPHVTERVRVYAAGRRMGTGMGPTVAEAKRDGAAKALLAWGKVFGGGVGE